jgi:hypothetical protein
MAAEIVALSGNRSLAELGSFCDNPGCDHGLVFAIPAEDQPRRNLEILPLDLASLADVCSQDAGPKGLQPAMSGLTTRCLLKHGKRHLMPDFRTTGDV